MTDKSCAQDAKATATAESLNAIARFPNTGIGNVMGMGTAWIEAFSDMSAELIGFVADRIKEDVKTQHEIMRCTNSADLRHIQSQFMQKTVDQYKAETGKLVEMGTDAFRTKVDN